MRPKPRLPEESICQNTFRRRSKGTRTVSEVGGYGEGALLVQAHALDALVPALNHLADTDYPAVSHAGKNDRKDIPHESTEGGRCGHNCEALCCG